jgi:hypothetical protein
MKGAAMKMISTKRIVLLGLLTMMGVGSHFAWAAPGDKYCPPLCTLPPDPAPPMPPINFPDPPFNPIVAKPSSNNNGKTATATAASATQAGGSTVVGKVQEGAECRSRNGNVEGTLVKEGSQFMCNFTPSTLKVGAACHANNVIGTVTVVAGDKNRYCQIAPIAVSDKAKPSDKK